MAEAAEGSKAAVHMYAKTVAEQERLTSAMSQARLYLLIDFMTFSAHHFMQHII